MLHNPCCNGYFNVVGTKGDPIPNMIELKLTYIPVKCGINNNPDSDQIIININ